MPNFRRYGSVQALNERQRIRNHREMHNLLCGTALATPVNQLLTSTRVETQYRGPRELHEMFIRECCRHLQHLSHQRRLIESSKTRRSRNSNEFCSVQELRTGKEKRAANRASMLCISKRREWDSNPRCSGFRPQVPCQGDCVRPLRHHAVQLATVWTVVPSRPASAGLFLPRSPTVSAPDDPCGRLSAQRRRYARYRLCN